MTGALYFFDECDELYRYPGGALVTPGRLRLRIKLHRNMTRGVRVAVYADGGEMQDSGAMSFSNAIPAVNSEMSGGSETSSGDDNQTGSEIEMSDGSDGTRELSMSFERVTGVYDLYCCELRFSKPGLYWYRFIIDSQDGEIAFPSYDESALQVTAFTQSERTPDWIQGGIIYHIFVDRFKRGGKLRLRQDAVYRDDWGGTPHYKPNEEGLVLNNDFFGGDLYGILEKLPYLEKLGVTCIYLSPVFDAVSNHKYDTGDYMSIDEAFGGDEAFELLCAEALKRGIRIILDGVFNHVGADSRYFNKYGRYEAPGAWQGEHSQYYDWFEFYDGNKYNSWWGIELLPATNKSSEGFRDHICGENGVIAHWTKKGVAGWRLDVVDELPDIFLYPLCSAIKRENSSALIAGEVWEDASNKVAYGVRRRYFLGGQLDSVTNYPLKDAIITFVRDGDAPRLSAVVASLCQNYPDYVLNSLMNILGTHDTMRILTILGGTDFPQDKDSMENYSLDGQQLEKGKKSLKLAAMLQFTLPGVPCVYYGDEAGMEGCIDPFNRRCYPWGNEDVGLIEWYTALSALRKAHNCFKDGKFELVEAHTGLFAFTRGQEHDRILIAVNASSGDREIAFEGFNFDLLKNAYTKKLIIRAGEAAVFAMR